MTTETAPFLDVREIHTRKILFDGVEVVEVFRFNEDVSVHDAVVVEVKLNE